MVETTPTTAGDEPEPELDQDEPAEPADDAPTDDADGDDEWMTV